jgi:hypothetical protein
MKAIPVLRLSTLTLLASLGLAAQADPGTARTDSSYQQEVARCNSGQSQEDRATCLKEARSAHADAVRGRLDNGQQGRYEANTLARCDLLPAADKQDCIHMMQGQGMTSGSVEGGGIYRELVTVQPASPSDSGAAASGTSGSQPMTSGTTSNNAESRPTQGPGSQGTMTAPPLEPAR